MNAPARLNRLALHWQILIALALALCAGLLSGDGAAVFGVRLESVYDFIGTLFLNALKMVALPLVATSIICGMAELGSGREFGRLGGQALAFYAASSLLAILVGLAAVNAVEPGHIDGEPAGQRPRRDPTPPTSKSINPRTYQRKSA